MAQVNPPLKNTAYICYIQLESFATPGMNQANPTLAAGDVKLIIDGVASTLGAASSDSLITLPAVTPAASRWVKVSLSAAEMNGDNIGIQFVDQTATKEWADTWIEIETVAAVWPTGAQNATAILGATLEGTYTVQQVLRLISAAAAGKLSGAAGTTVTIRDISDALDRIVATVDSSGNRSAVTVNVS